MGKINVVVNGSGVIGRRVADAVSVQKDMNLVGVTKTRPDYIAEFMAAKGYPIYVAGDDTTKAQLKFAKAGIQTSGTLEDALRENVHVVVDATPEDTGVTNKPLYERAGVRAIFQGGEEADVAPMSFNAYANFNQVAEAQPTDVRVVSCNTTGLARTVSALDRAFGVEEVKVVLIRRAADPGETKKGPINSIELEETPFSHHGEDLMTVLPDVRATSIAAKAPTTLMHAHIVNAELREQATPAEILDAFAEFPRILIGSYGSGIKGTAQWMDVAREFGRPRSDLFEVGVWANVSTAPGTVSQVGVEPVTVQYTQAVHQEAIVVPENIDAIRALYYGRKIPAEESIRMTDQSLGIVGMKALYRPAPQKTVPTASAAEPAMASAGGK